jgi:hypothetical protein
VITLFAQTIRAFEYTESSRISSRWYAAFKDIEFVFDGMHFFYLFIIVTSFVKAIVLITMFTCPRVTLEDKNTRILIAKPTISTSVNHFFYQIFC